MHDVRICLHQRLMVFMNLERENASITLEYAAIEVLVKRWRLAHLTEVKLLCVNEYGCGFLECPSEEVDNGDVDRPFSVSQQDGIDGICGKAVAVVLIEIWQASEEYCWSGMSIESVE